MNKREKILLAVLIVVVGGGFGGFGIMRWWWNPLLEYNAKIQTLSDEVGLKQADVDLFRLGQQKLNQARLKSLPADEYQASAEYQLQYLKPLLDESGLSVETITRGQTQRAMKPVTALQGVTTVNHKIMTFSVRAHGELSSLVTALERMQKTPYEHRTKTLTVYRSDATTKKGGNELKIEMEIEVLLVAGTKNTPGAPLHPELSPPTPADRLYAKIPKRDIFVGALPAEIVYETEKNNGKPVVIVKKPVVPPEPEETTPAYVFLTHTSPDEQIAYMRNRVYQPVGSQEIKLDARKGSGYDTFKVTDEVGSFLFFRAKLLRVEQRQVYIQIKDQVFTVGIGKSLGDMQRYGYNKSVIDLDDEGLIDLEFMKVEMAKDKQDNKGKAPVKKGR